MGVLSVCIGTAPIGFIHVGWLATELGGEGGDVRPKGGVVGEPHGPGLQPAVPIEHDGALDGDPQAAHPGVVDAARTALRAERDALAEEQAHLDLELRDMERASEDAYALERELDRLRDRLAELEATALDTIKPPADDIRVPIGVRTHTFTAAEFAMLREATSTGDTDGGETGRTRTTAPIPHCPWFSLCHSFHVTVSSS